MHSLWIIPVYHNINHSVQQLCSQHDLQLHLPFHQSHVSPAVSLYSHPEDQQKQCLAPGLLQHPLWDTVSDDNSTNKFHLFSDICQWKLNTPVETTCTSLNCEHRHFLSQGNLYPPVSSVGTAKICKCWASPPVQRRQMIDHFGLCWFRCLNVKFNILLDTFHQLLD